MLGVGEITFLRQEHTNWLSNSKWSAMCTYISLEQLTKIEAMDLKENKERYMEGLEGGKGRDR